jgi:hypothetical protein
VIIHRQIGKKWQFIHRKTWKKMQSSIGRLEKNGNQSSIGRCENNDEHP